ncbi:pyruvate dehydrogenase complex dihydrolipoamide acetyltransferase [Ferrovibrio sp.]|uniref:pyruvate dehydrogenase complex dihydrolipoamide acetyltransferase n=1 Tax=Ferrovibrio sp. TaxID=1917215 RepID=UPI003D0D393F
MPIEILMPALSPTMTEGKLAKWLIKEGDTVKAGDVMAEIETDKATMEFEAVDEGVLEKILIAEGTEGVAVNTPIALLRGEDEKPGAAPAPKAAPAAAPAAAAPAAAPAPKPAPAAAAASAPASAPAHGGERVFASPLARRIAADASLDLKAIAGSGPHGRIVKADVEAAKAGGGAKKAAPAAAGAPAPKPAVPAPAGPGARQLADLLKMPYRLEPLSMMRKTIARRLTESKQTVPHFYLTIDCELDELLSLRTRLNAKAESKISVNDFVVRAVALALKKVPAANGSYDETGLMYYEHADISVAVATPNGLITPIVKAAEGKGLAQIAAETKDLAARARDGKLKPEEFQGGTFSVSNLGMFGIKQFAAVINPPQGCILAVGAGEQRAVVKNGQLAVATVMSCTLSVDHRVVDGAVGAEFLQVFKSYVEDPLTMLL